MQSAAPDELAKGSSVRDAGASSEDVWQLKRRIGARGRRRTHRGSRRLCDGAAYLASDQLGGDRRRDLQPGLLNSRSPHARQPNTNRRHRCASLPSSRGTAASISPSSMSSTPRPSGSPRSTNPSPASSPTTGPRPQPQRHRHRQLTRRARSGHPLRRLAMSGRLDRRETHRPRTRHPLGDVGSDGDSDRDPATQIRRDRERPRNALHLAIRPASEGETSDARDPGDATALIRDPEPDPGMLGDDSARSFRAWRRYAGLVVVLAGRCLPAQVGALGADQST